MPQLVEREVEALAVRVDDKILTVDGLKGHVLSGREVTKTTRKTKLTHIEAGAWKSALAHGSKVVVARSERTPEEVAEARHRFSMAYIQQQIDTSHSFVEEAKADLVENLDYLPSGWTHGISSLAEAKVWDSLWTSVKKAAAAGSYHGFECEDLVAAARAIVEEIRDDAVEWRPLSRSTSVLHNALSDAEFAARLAWVRRLEYYIR